MNAITRKNSIALAILFALRMFGLFIILPVFTLHAQKIPGGADLFWVGFALGAFGLTQVFCQIPYGIASDIFGRKPLILLGLFLFASGSLLGFFSQDLLTLTLARALQGAGAFSGVITALATDIIPDSDITKTMAMIGSTIALMFALSLVFSPIFYGYFSLNGIFLLVFCLTLPALWILYQLPENPASFKQKSTVNAQKISKFAMLKSVFFNGDLALLNIGIFLLSIIQTAFFIVVPARLLLENLAAFEHWKAYLPAIFTAFLVMVPFIIFAEKKNKMAFVFRLNIAFILLTALGLYFSPLSLWLSIFWLFLFFVAFNVLEATLPLLVARRSPSHLKGSAMGIYNTAQSAGMFVGGGLGGLLAKYAGHHAILLGSFLIGIIWLWLTKNQNFAPKKS